jgi:hypothetical protein
MGSPFYSNAWQTWLYADIHNRGDRTAIVGAFRTPEFVRIFSGFYVSGLGLGVVTGVGLSLTRSFGHDWEGAVISLGWSLLQVGLIFLFFVLAGQGRRASENGKRELLAWLARSGAPLSRRG